MSDMLAFKIWKLRKSLQYLAIALAFAVLAVGAWAVWEFWDSVLVKAITVGALAMMLVMMGLTALGTALVGKKLMKVIRLRETLIRAAVGLGIGIFGWLAARLHLHVFDPMFLREGSIDNYRRRFHEAERGGGEHAAHGGNGHEPASLPAQELAALPATPAAPAAPATIAAPAAPLAAPAETLAAAQPTAEQFPDRIEIREDDGAHD